ncbi:MAG TPA: patatin-like phospholipase family protein [Limnochordales bacterium]
MQAPVGLVLSGGGARGAYQAGALRALAQRWAGPPFSVVSGSSIGALHAACVAEGLEGEDLPGVAARLEQQWRELREVLRPNWKSFLQALLGWLLRRPAGRVWGSVVSLLDEEPVLRALTQFVPAGRRMGDYRRVELVVTATDLNAGRTICFDRSTPEVPVVEAVLASAAFPVAFRSRRIRGHWHVDGGVFDNAPLSHAIRRGCRSVVVIATTPACDAEGPPPVAGEFADIWSVMRRLWPLMLDRLLYDELRDTLRQGRVQVLLICPGQELDPPGTFGFENAAAIHAAIDRGHRDALQALAAHRPALAG